MTAAHEVNFDGLVGPTHGYAGLSYGNLASLKSKQTVSNPRRAALEGLAKMKHLADLGVRQAVLPPQERPSIATLRALGFDGTEQQILERAWREDPVLLGACSSASSMWAANAATVSPAADTADARLHFTPARMASTLHRSIEHAHTAATLRAIFPDQSHFAHHTTWPGGPFPFDEGAANHLRLCTAHGDEAIEIFVFGRSGMNPEFTAPTKFPARQTLEASRAIARLHHLDPAATLFLQQNPAAIDAGAFHNDVVCVANRNVLLLHEHAFLNQPKALESIRRSFGAQLHVIQISDNEISLPEAVETYLFNSQIVDLPDGTMRLIAPTECEANPRAVAVINRILAADNPITSVDYVTVNQSMKNGGGPACLRLRIVLTPAQLSAAAPGVFLTDTLHAQLVAWVTKHYREELHPHDLADVRLLHECRDALAELAQILHLKLK
jgi:succinylarginine dihydrolase